MLNDFYKSEKILKIILLVIGANLIAFIFLMIFYANWEINNVEKEFPSFNLNKKELKQEQEKKIILPKITYSLAGTIEEINLKESYIIFEASIPESEKENQIIYRKEMRKIFVNPDTKINKLIFFVDENNKKTIQEATFSFKDLKPKDYIEVVSKQDISNIKEFSAIQIRVQP